MTYISEIKYRLKLVQTRNFRAFYKGYETGLKITADEIRHKK